MVYMYKVCVDFKTSQFISLCGYTKHEKNSLGNMICITVYNFKNTASSVYEYNK